jgi:hypothetical protein
VAVGHLLLIGSRLSISKRSIQVASTWRNINKKFMRPFAQPFENDSLME